jgi:hypothetical protein
MKKSLAAFFKKIIPVIVALIFVVSVSGCKKEEGPMEQAGQLIDKSVESSKDDMKQAGESVKKDPEKEKAALVISGQWLTLVDAGKSLESWQEGNEYFRNSVKQEQWQKVVQTVRTRLGKVISRKLKNKIYQEAMPGEPQGHYIVMQYETSFQNNKLATEEVSMFEENGVYRVSGYHLR